MAAVIVGGSISGLASALVLADLGHEVQILERDRGVPPETVEEAHRHWPRPTVPQATHSHAFASLGCNLPRTRAPSVYRALIDAGATEIRLGESMPPSLSDRSPEPGDDDLLMLACRRSTFEWALRREVLRLPQVRVEPGAVVRSLEFGNGDGRRVVGARTQDGRTFTADLVIDACGRRSAATRWLSEAGIPVAEDQVGACEITYYTRFYRLLADQPPGPLNRGFGAGGLWDHYTAVLFLGDNRTFSISIGVLPDDPEMKLLRSEPAFTAALRATPLLAPWLSPGASVPISGVHAMGGLDNCLRGVATSKQSPAITGLYHVGDSVCTTNPAYGRGISLAFAHAYQLGDVLSSYPDVGNEQAREVAHATERLFSPWVAEAVQNDRGRAMLWKSTINGTSLPPMPPGMVTFGSVVAAAATDPVVWRRVARVMMMLAPPTALYADEEIRGRVAQAFAAGAPPQIPAPSREELVSVVTSAADLVA